MRDLNDIGSVAADARGGGTLVADSDRNDVHGGGGEMEVLNGVDIVADRRVALR